MSNIGSYMIFSERYINRLFDERLYDRERTKNESKKDIQFSRRGVLKNTGGVMIASGVLGTASASPDGSTDHEVVQKRTSRVVEIKLTAETETPSEGRLAKSVSCSFAPNYYVENRRAFIVHRGMNELTNRSIHVTTPSDVIGLAGNTIEVNLPMALKSDFNGLVTRTFETAGNTSNHEFVISIGSDRSIVQKGSTELLSVKPGQTGSKMLDKVNGRTYIYEQREINNPRDTGGETETRNVKVGKGETDVRTRITVKDNGQIPVFSTSRRNVLPKSMPGAKALIKEAEQATDLEVDEIQPNIVTIREVTGE